VKAIAALVVPRACFLIGVRANEGRVDVEDQFLGASTERKRTLARHLASVADAFQLGRPDPLDQPEGGGVRSDVPEQVGLVTKRCHIREVLAARHQRDDQIAQDLPIIVSGAALTSAASAFESPAVRPSRSARLTSKSARRASRNPLRPP